MLFFDFALSKKINALKKIGFTNTVRAYKDKLKQNQFTKLQYERAINSLYEQNITAINNVHNPNVATTQNFLDSNTIPPLNLEKIQTEIIDVDLIQSSILFEYQQHARIHYTALKALKSFLINEYKYVNIEQNSSEKFSHYPTKELITIITKDIQPNLAAEFLQIINTLLQR